MIIRNSSPCHNCEERHKGCHSHCENYKVWKAEWQKKKEKLDGIAERERMLNEFAADGCRRVSKTSRR